MVYTRTYHKICYTLWLSVCEENAVFMVQVLGIRNSN